MRRIWLAGFVLALASVACGVLPGSAPAPSPTAEPTVVPTAAVTATRPPATATTTAAPKPTSTPAPANTVYVGNTDGEGVYIRKTPNMADRIKAYPDGTELTIIGDDVEGDGQQWHQVRAPDGTEGYVPSMYTTDSPP